VNETLRALLRYTKRQTCAVTWTDLRDNVLAAIYHRDMKFVDVVKVLLGAYTQALMEPRFELPGRHSAAEDLLLSPIKGSHAIELLGPTGVETQYSVEQFYGAMIEKMMADLRCCRVDWCRNEIWPFDDFKTLVLAARPEPDLQFSFTVGDGPAEHEARWTFPGSRHGGGSAMLEFTSGELIFGMAEGDVQAWIAYEESHGRDPRWA